MTRIGLICTDKFSFFSNLLIDWNTDYTDWADLHYLRHTKYIIYSVLNPETSVITI